MTHDEFTGSINWAPGSELEPGLRAEALERFPLARSHYSGTDEEWFSRYLFPLRRSRPGFDRRATDTGSLPPR